MHRVSMKINQTVNHMRVAVLYATNRKMRIRCKSYSLASLNGLERLIPGTHNIFDFGEDTTLPLPTAAIRHGRHHSRAVSHIGIGSRVAIRSCWLLNMHDVVHVV